MIIDRKRKTNFQTFKIKGEKKYELHMETGFGGYRQFVNISLEYGGKLATSIGNAERYEISFAKLPDDVKEQVKVAIAYIEANGTPMENDELVFNYG